MTRARRPGSALSNPCETYPILPDIDDRRDCTKDIDGEAKRHGCIDVVKIGSVSSVQDGRVDLHGLDRKDEMRAGRACGSDLAVDDAV